MRALTILTTCLIALSALAGPVHVTPITDRWVAVSVSTIDDVIVEIDRLSEGAYLPAVEHLRQVRANNGPRLWQAEAPVDGIRAQFLEQARANVEAKLLDPATYTPRPLRVGTQVTGVGERATEGGTNPEYVITCYLELPEGVLPLRIAVDGEEIAYDNCAPSRAIKINQVGYLPNGPKYAYVGLHLYGIGPLEVAAEAFQVIDALTGEVAYKAPITVRDHMGTSKSGRIMTGEIVYSLDFSGLTDPGAYYLRVPGVGRSWEFRIDPDVYGEIAYTSLRGLMYQRCGSDLSSQPWPRKRCHTAPVYESDWIMFPNIFADAPTISRFDVIGATLDKGRLGVKHPTGGWHDAADWDRNSASYAVLFDLLYAYELNPGKFTDGQLNLPEAGNGIPDILDEALHGINIWSQSMDKAGGVSGMVETNTHPTIDADVAYAFARRTRWDSLLFSSASAMIAQHLKPFDEKAAARWQWLAQKAYTYGADPKNSLGTVTINAKHQRGTGEAYSVQWTETEAHLAPFLAHTKARMYALTGKAEYLKGIEALAPTIRPYQWRFTMKDYSAWLAFGCRKYLPASTFTKPADELLVSLATAPYRATWPRDQDFFMAWGNVQMTNYSRVLLIAHMITGETKYRDAALLNFDFMLGANPLGMSWTTGIGQQYPINIQHAVSNYDGIADPVPGITIYGVTGGMYGNLRALGLHETPVWRCYSQHPKLSITANEFTVQETMAAPAFVAAWFMPAGWTPSRTLINRKPKPLEELHGIYALP